MHSFGVPESLWYSTCIRSGDEHTEADDRHTSSANYKSDIRPIYKEKVIRCSSWQRSRIVDLLHDEVQRRQSRCEDKHLSVFLVDSIVKATTTASSLSSLSSYKEVERGRETQWRPDDGSLDEGGQHSHASEAQSSIRLRKQNWLRSISAHTQRHTRTHSYTGIYYIYVLYM